MTRTRGLAIGGTYHEAEAVDETLGTPMTAFDEASFVPDRYLEDDESAIASGRFTGTHGETGKPVETSVVRLREFEDGEANEPRRYADTVGLNCAFEPRPRPRSPRSPPRERTRREYVRRRPVYGRYSVPTTAHAQQRPAERSTSGFYPGLAQSSRAKSPVRGISNVQTF